MKNYFTPAETSCKCGCGLDITPEMRAVANRVREEWGGPVVVSSGARCEKHNKAVGGAKRSAHVEGLAVDLRPGRGSMEAFHDFCIERLNKWGVRMEAPEYTRQWAHLDLRPPSGKSRLFIP